MSPAGPSWVQINAYVDGELSASDAAEVARVLAEDKTLAEAVATLSRLKAATQEGLEPFALAPRRRKRPWRRIAIAASVAVGLAVVAAASLLPWMTPAAPPSWLAEAWKVHDTWARDQAVTPPRPLDSGLVLATLHQFGPETYVPDLSDARLTLSHLEITVLANNRGEALHIGYLGNRGCQVSLVVGPRGDDIPADLVRYDRGAGRGYAWRDGRIGYLLIAEGMDEARLALLAETLRRATVERRPFGPGTRSALRESRNNSAPCLSS